MGIPSYFSYILKNHCHVFKKTIEFNKVDNLYLDSNSIIYDCLREIETNIEEKNNKYRKENIHTILYDSICKKIEFYIQEIKPSNVVFITFDGVAPMAKIEQQRQRRHKSKFIQEIEYQIKKKQTSIFDKTLITPGTNFMNQLDVYVKRYFSNINVCKKIIISGTNDIGEGEHKIFKFIRDNKEYHSKTTTFVYGLDADLIMLCLNHLSISKNIYLFRENPNYNEDLNLLFEKNELCIMDISKLSHFIIQHMINHKNIGEISNNNFNIKYKLYDYILISFLLGNDFMPHFPSLNIRTNGIEILMETYKNIVGETEYLCDGENIIWKKFRIFISELAKNEKHYFIEEYKYMNRQEKRIIKSKTNKDKLVAFNLFPTKNRQIEKYINPFEKNWEQRYYSSLFHIPRVKNNDTKQENRIKNICINYLEGLEWCLKYYTTGCVNYKWCYQYNYPPLLQDLIKFVPVFGCNMIENDYTFVRPLTQLAYVIPCECYSILPETLQERLIQDSDIEIQNVDEYEYITAFCKYFWECHVELPVLDIEKIEYYVREFELNRNKE